MKFGLILLLSLVFLSAFLVACKESVVNGQAIRISFVDTEPTPAGRQLYEGGNPLILGMVNNFYADQCTKFSNTRVIQYYCDATGTVKRGSMDCPGGTICSNGVCVSSASSSTSCNDSDGGVNTGVTGTVTTNLGTFADTCQGADVVEYSCSQAQQAVSSVLLCGTSASCQGGRCVRSVCGNRVVEPGEQCDDQNQLSKDGCSNSCTKEQGYWCPKQGGSCRLIEPGLFCGEDKKFNVFVLMDDTSYTATDQEIRDYFTFTSQLLYDRTCVVLNITQIFHVSINNPSDIDPITYNLMSQNSQIVRNANGFVIFTEKLSCARLNGGCAWGISPSYQQIGINNYCNTYARYDRINNILYGSVIDWNHLYGACGYDEDQTQRISSVSVNGQCRNQPGTQCVLHNGYYICQNLVNTYYASDARLMPASTIIHEIMHHYGFGADGYIDHNVGSPGCLNEYRHTLDNVLCPANGDLADCFFNMCQYTYENFIRAENICS